MNIYAIKRENVHGAILESFLKADSITSAPHSSSVMFEVNGEVVKIVINIISVTKLTQDKIDSCKKKFDLKSDDEVFDVLKGLNGF